MKTLTLIRHAKSDWSIVGQADFDRGLNTRGKKQLKFLETYFEKNPSNAEKILCSTANRAKLTYNGISKNTDFAKIPVEFYDEIYDFHMQDVEKFADFIRFLNDDLNSIIIIGHNPMFDNFIAEYTHSLIHMPTASIVEIVFDIEHWTEIRKGSINLFLTPKQ